MKGTTRVTGRFPAIGRISRAVPGLILVLAILSGLPWTGASRALAAAGEWARADMIEARLVSAVTGTGGLGRVPLGLHLRMAPGWKTYWRSPGDAGLPPRIDWTGSTGLDGAEIGWPAPHRFTLFGIETFGYEHEVVFPIEAGAAEPGGPMALKAGVDVLVCSDICVPQRFDLALDVPAGPASPGAEAQLVNRFRSAIPGDGAVSGLSVERVVATGSGIEAVVLSREPLVEPDLFVETAEGHAFGAPRIDFAEDGRRATIRLPLAEGMDRLPPLGGMETTLTVVDGPRAAEIRSVVSPEGGSSAASEGGPAAVSEHGLMAVSEHGLMAVLGVALLGGLLLNLMPCVLPVLSLKLFSVMGHGGAPPRAVRAGFLSSAAGILASFLVLAAALAGLKQAGAAVGWGIQFQQPLFLVFMVVLVTLFACNLWGLFEIPLPRFLADAGGRGHGAGGGDGHPSLAGHFSTGMLATLLATPCSAPFVGTAVGFALARGPAEIFAVFLALGAGLASPYLLVAAAPRLAARLPRPGRWMVALRRVLALALAATALWLLGVLSSQLSPEAGTAVAVLMLSAAALLALRRRFGGGLRLAGAVLAGGLFAAAFALPLFADMRSGAAARAEDARWAPFDRAAVAPAVAAGRTVFVDVTADWCITCKANKALVIDRGEVARRLSGDGVVAMRADWTRPDPAISAFLSDHGRYGIPFNIVYGPGAPEGIVLPELLSEGAVLDALDRAAERPAS
jgi:suppressor for copper-sensitivity B